MPHRTWFGRVWITAAIVLFAGMLTGPVMAQSAELDELKRELAEVEARRAALQARIDAVEGKMTEAEAEAMAAAERAEAEARALKAKITGIEFEGLTGKGLTRDQLMQTQIRLTQYGQGYAAPFNQDFETMTLGEIGTAEGRVLYASALKHIVDTVSRAYTNANLAAVRVNIMRSDLQDVMDADGGVLTITITEGIVGGVATGGDMEQASDRYQKIVKNSPVRSGEMVNLEQVDRYVYWLNRHPGRQVDVALVPGDQAGEVVLEYMVAESKPWFVYFQVANTGTEATSEWRERIGFTHLNLTGNDDILVADYITANFDEIHAGQVSYDFPLFPEHRIRSRIYGGASTYEASEVGFADEAFEGETYSFGAELVWNFFQDKDLFVDAVLGGRYMDVDVTNNIIEINGSDDFWFLYGGVTVEQRNPLNTMTGSLIIEAAFDGDTTEVQKLGRAAADDEWVLAKYDFSYSVFLEPWLNDDWGQPGSGSTLAHELYTAVRGQIVLGDERLPPNFTYPVGGFYTVRGHDESFTSADSSLVWTLEYRFHLPRVLTPREPKDSLGGFKVAPDRELGRPDWDLILRGFLDVGYAHINQEISTFEDSVVLVGAGIGFELQFKHNATLRVDWGFALNDENTGTDTVDAGDDELHISFTLMY